MVRPTSCLRSSFFKRLKRFALQGDTLAPSLSPLLGYRLRALMVEQLRATRLFFGCDRRRILSQLFSDRDPLLNSGPLADRGEPPLQVGEFFQLDTSPLPERRPGIADHIG